MRSCLLTPPHTEFHAPIFLHHMCLHIAAQSINFHHNMFIYHHVHQNHIHQPNFSQTHFPFILSSIISMFIHHHLLIPSYSLDLSAILMFHHNKNNLTTYCSKELSREPSMQSKPINQPSRKLSFKTQRTSFLKKGFTFEFGHVPRAELNSPCACLMTKRFDGLESKQLKKNRN